MTEQWRAIPKWEGLYEVSDQGRVRSLSRRVPHRVSGSLAISGRVLVQSPKRDGRNLGHLVVTLIDSASRRRRVAPVHHLVLEAFVGPRPPGFECCHANDDGTDNRLTNLRWDTRSANVRDQVVNGLHNFLGENRTRWSA